MSNSGEAIMSIDLSPLMNQDGHDFMTNPEVTASLVADVHCQLGECILYDDVKHLLLWTDILGRSFFQLCLDSGRITKYALPKMLCAFAMRPSSLPGYLCAWEDGFEFYDLEQGTSLSPPSNGPDVNPKKQPTRLNDGRCHPNGRDFICGGYYGDLTDGTKMQVFKCSLSSSSSLSPLPHEEDYQLVHETIVEEIEVTNSICFSPDGGTIMYMTDSPSRQIHAYDYDHQAAKAPETLLSGKRLLFTVPSTLGVPDGSCTDAEGFVWNAVWRDGRGPGIVNRIDPTTSEVVGTVHIPDETSQVSCCCIGGRDLNILFITTAAVGRDGSEPHAGAIYAIKLKNIIGQKEARFGPSA